MKHTLLKIAGILILTLSVANADPINGRLTFTGGVVFDNNLSPDINFINVATSVTAWSNTTVLGATGDFATYVASGDAVNFHAPWSFNSGAVSNFWSVDGYQFDLVSSSIVFQGFGFISVSGTGTASGHGFDPSLGTWSFSSQNPSGNGGVFSFSGGTAVPDGGTTALLIGLGLVGLGVAVRRQKTV